MTINIRTERISNRREHTMKRAGTRAFVVTMAATAGLAVGADGAVAGATFAPPASTSSPASAPDHNRSALHCRLALTVSFNGSRFESAPGGDSSCFGLLLGQSVVGGTRPSATGSAKFMHHGRGLPPLFGAARVQVQTLGLPFGPHGYRYSTRLKLALKPAHLKTFAASSYTGTTRVRGRDHEVSATLAYSPPTTASRESRGCCATGRLIIDLHLRSVLPISAP